MDLRRNKELYVIPGGVLGFWGGVGSLGTMFLMILLSQKYCCVEKEVKPLTIIIFEGGGIFSHFTQKLVKNA